MKFSKMHGAGNDFIIFNGTTERLPNYSDLAKRVCDRHFGIGADGILVLEESQVADIKMTYFNADGSKAEMCGNGIRCFVKYAYDNNYIDKEEVDVETLAGIIKSTVILTENRVDKVRVNMGKPLIRFINREMKIEGMRFIMSHLDVGPPHVVIFLELVEGIEVKKIGPIIENHQLFPEGTNVNFCEVIDTNNIKVLTWERGSGQTLACGTGASAVGAIANYLRLTNDKVNIHLLGGVLEIEIVDENVYLTGTAELICQGEYYWD